MLKKQVPAIQDYVRFICPGPNMLIRSGNKAGYWNDVYMTDPGVFRVFTYKILHGGPGTALQSYKTAMANPVYTIRYE